MSDELTPEEQAQMEALLRYAAKPATQADMDRLVDGLSFRRRPRWLVRGGVAAFATAAAAALVLVVMPRGLPAPPAEVLRAEVKAAQTADVAAVDEAMQAYRRDLVRSPAMKAAEPVYARVDAALAAADFPLARAELLVLTESDERVIVRDAHFRLAVVELRAGAPREARAHADRGLALGKPTDIFTVNLLLARAASARALGDKTAEADDLYNALLMSEALYAE